MTLLGALGLCGVAMYLLSYALLQLGYVRGSGHTYTLMNMAAATLVLFSLLEAFNLSSLLIQVSWITISIVGLTRRYLRHRSLTFDERERHIAAQIVPSLSGTDLRNFLDTGGWVNLPRGAKLTDQGEPVDYLYFVHRGQADVFLNWVKVADVTDDHFVGEMTCLTGAPATATVVLTSASECFRIPATRLRSFMLANPAIQEQLERSFAIDLKRKLNASATLVSTLNKAQPAPRPDLPVRDRLPRQSWFPRNAPKLA